MKTSTADPQIRSPRSVLASTRGVAAPLVAPLAMAMALSTAMPAVESEPIPGVFLLPDGQVQIVATQSDDNVLAVTPMASGGVRIALNGLTAQLSAGQSISINYQGGAGGLDSVEAQVPLGTVLLCSSENTYQGGCDLMQLFGGGNSVDTAGEFCDIEEFGGPDDVTGANAMVIPESDYTLSVISGVVINQGVLCITPFQPSGNSISITEDDGIDLVVTENGVSESFDTTALTIDSISCTTSAGGGDVIENDSLVGMDVSAFSSGNALIDTSGEDVTFYLLGDEETAEVGSSGGSIYVEGRDEMLSGDFAADIAIVEDGGSYTLLGDGTTTTTTAGGSTSAAGSTTSQTGMAGGAISGGCGLGGGAALMVMGAIALGRLPRRRQL